MSSKWTDKPLRIIQTNLQVRDTEAIDPDRLARQIEELGGNTLVFNVGGIYAWYDTDVRHHTKNPHLQEKRDLLEEIIEACHERDITFIGRVDFSKANDEVFAHQPNWFARDPSGESLSIGAERPGGWSVLKYTCLNSAYRKDAVAVPVLEELISRYDLDGIFYNAPHYITCHCDTCRRKYEDQYGEQLPDDPEDFHEEWAEQCVQDNMEQRYNIIKELDEDVQTILYYHSNGKDLTKRNSTTDILCTESQNVVSLGHRDLPDTWKPARTMKIANAIPGGSPPIGIIHASPGMDWRHVGLPPAEYEFWLSQIPANNGSIWHTLTGVPDTVLDNRILDVVGDLNEKVEQLEPYMASATSAARTVLLWDDTETTNGLLDGLTQRQIPFDLLLSEQASVDRLAAYDLVIIPAGWEYTPEFIEGLRQYSDRGGRMLVEGNLPDDADELFNLLGVTGNTYTGESLVSSYSRFEGDDNPLQHGLKETEFLAHRGHVHYCEAAVGTETLMTLVPKWSPLEAVGRPPERASLPVAQTEIPMVISNPDRQSLYLPYSLSQLLSKYRIESHYQLLENAVDLLLGDQRFVNAAPTQGLQLTPYAVDDGYLLHLVNGVGSRPLVTNTPLPELDVHLSVEEETTVDTVRSLFSETELAFEQNYTDVTFTVPSVDVWDTVLVQSTD